MGARAARGSMAATLLLLLATAAAARLGHLARRETGDIFTLQGSFLFIADALEWTAS